VGSTQVKIPFFTNAFPLQSRRKRGVNPASPPQVLSVIEAKPVKLKDLLFLLAPPRFSDLPTALSLLSVPTISESFSTCTSGPAEQGGGQLPPKPLQILTDLDAKTVQLYDFLLIPPRFTDLPPCLYMFVDAQNSSSLPDFLATFSCNKTIFVTHTMLEMQKYSCANCFHF
jgi:hypothetical protein